MVILKKHFTTDKKCILALCDEEMLGKIFAEGEKQLDLSSSFYKGEKASDEAAKKEIYNAYSVNMVGEKIMAFALKNKIISKDNVKKIKKISYAHFTEQ